MSHKARLPWGILAGVLAISANAAGALLGGTVRAILAVPVLALSGMAAQRAFKATDEMRPDTDEERYTSQAAMALVALAIAEGIVVLVAIFIWVVARST